MRKYGHKTEKWKQKLYINPRRKSITLTCQEKKANKKSWLTSISSVGYFFLSTRTWIKKKNDRNSQGMNSRTRDAVGRSRKFKVTFSIISGMNFCPPNPGSTVITRTISTGFSPSICGSWKYIIFSLDSRIPLC